VSVTARAELDAQAGLALEGRAQPPGLQHRRIARLDQRAAGVAQQRPAFRAGPGQVLVEPARHQRRVVLGDVVEVVGDAAAHVLARVVLQRLQQRQRGARISDQAFQLQPPGQARAAAFADQPPHMRALVAHPAGERVEHQARVVDDEGPDREFGREALRQRVQRAQGALRVRLAVACDVLAHGPQDPAPQALLQALELGHLLAGLGRRERGVEQPGGGVEVARQRRFQRGADVRRTRLHLQGVETGRRQPCEAADVEARCLARQVRGGSAHQRRVDQVLEGLGHGRQPSRTGRCWKPRKRTRRSRSGGPAGSSRG
jgi:hypothetical protein